MGLSLLMGCPTTLVPRQPSMAKREDPNDPGITWVELLLDFEIATRVQLLGKGARTRPTMKNPRTTDIAQRANNFAHAAKRMYELCGGEKIHLRKQVSTLTPFNGGALARGGPEAKING